MRGLEGFVIVNALAATCCASGLAAQERDQGATPPGVVIELIDCRAIVNDTQRLACYDVRTDALVKEQQAGNLIIADRQQIREARRGLFGFTLPRLRIFGGDDEEGTDEEAVRIFDGVIKTARESVDGYVFELQEGGTWVQVENRYPGVIPKPGQKMRIRRGALGGYLASIDGGGRGFRIKRLR